MTPAFALLLVSGVFGFLVVATKLIDFGIARHDPIAAKRRAMEHATRKPLDGPGRW